jgi:hypothetical protein
MSLQEIQEIFRAQELQRRLNYNAALLRNHEALMKETLSVKDAKTNAAAVEILKQDFFVQEKRIRPSYWRRLWAALLNK